MYGPNFLPPSRMRNPGPSTRSRRSLQGAHVLTSLVGTPVFGINATQVFAPDPTTSPAPYSLAGSYAGGSAVSLGGLGGPTGGVYPSPSGPFRYRPSIAAPVLGAMTGSAPG